MSITREQLNLAIATVRNGGEGAEYIYAANLLADVASGTDVSEFCDGSGKEPHGSQCGDCYYEHGFVVPDHYVVERS